MTGNALCLNKKNMDLLLSQFEGFFLVVSCGVTHSHLDISHITN